MSSSRVIINQSLACQVDLSSSFFSTWNIFEESGTKKNIGIKNYSSLRGALKELEQFSVE